MNDIKAYRISAVLLLLFFLLINRELVSGNAPVFELDGWADGISLRSAIPQELEAMK